MGFEKKYELRLDIFKASEEWIRKFKSNHRIVSRKITKFISHNYTKEELDINQTAKDFVNENKHLFKHG